MLLKIIAHVQYANLVFQEIFSNNYVILQKDIQHEV